MSNPADLAHKPYRKCVGLCLFNNQGLVLAAERRDKANAWQMPQGGLNPDEPYRVAALRELKEEIGTDAAEIIGEAPHTLTYDFPERFQRRRGVFRGKYRGQEQLWFALRFLGQDSDITLNQNAPPEPPEFVSWKWMSLEEIGTLIVDFKKPVYDQVITFFSPLAQALKRGERLPVL